MSMVMEVFKIVTQWIGIHRLGGAGTMGAVGAAETGGKGGVRIGGTGG